ncbi:iron ABC transporter permease [Brachybacterium sp. EF45031]|nr:iron ABC transporter permease [Brachybacterium sillae]
MIARVLLGTPVIAPADALAVLRGEMIPGVSFIVLHSRLPVTVVGVLAGIAFGAAGCLFQTLLRNPLASPDVIGVSLGASTGGVLALAVASTAAGAQFWGSLIGGVTTAVLVLLIAGAHRGTAGRGRVDNRFVLVGVGIGAALSAVISYVVTRLPSRAAGDALHWSIGSLTSSTWPRAQVLALSLAVLLPLLAALRTRLRILQLGEETAAGLGVPVVTTRLALIGLGVLFTSLAVAVTGPIAFVALLAGPIARALAGRPSLVDSALVGAVIVVGGDVLGSTAFGPVDLPVGVLTGALGAPFLLWLLTRTEENR